MRPLCRAPARPSIHEIAASILSPSRTCHARSMHNLSRSAPRASVNRHTSSPLSRTLSSTGQLLQASKASPPPTRDRGPASSETTQTDFGMMDVLGNTPVPTTSIDACLWDGFHLNNGVKITEGAGVLLIAGEAFSWRPWELEVLGKNKLINKKGQWEVGDDAWGVFGLVWPKPGNFSVNIVIACDHDELMACDVQIC